MRNKRILFLGYYDDYARFYGALAQSLKEKGFKSLFFYQNLSGFLFSITHLNRACWLSFMAGLNYFFYCSFRLKFKKIFFPSVKISDRLFLKYNLFSNRNLTKKQKRRLILQLHAYERYVKNIFDSQDITMVLLPGDARIVELVFKIECEKRGIKVFYFEQGPYGTTMIDTKGVNANASIRMTGGGKFEFSNNQYNIDSLRYNRFPFYRAMDILFERALGWSSLFPEDCREQKTFSLEQTYMNLESENIPKPYILLALQLPNDANYTHHNPLFSSYSCMLEKVYDALPDEYSLVVREHPLFIGRYDKSIYDFIAKKHRVLLCSQQSLTDSILASDLVIVNNSTTGMDALKLGKPIVVLGNAYYDQLSIVKKVKQIEDIRKDIIQSVSFKETDHDFKTVIDKFVSSSFLPGHFRDKNLSNLSKKITSIFAGNDSD